jgi:hypothetical protein
VTSSTGQKCFGFSSHVKHIETNSQSKIQPQDEIKAFETRASRTAAKPKGIPGMPPPNVQAPVKKATAPKQKKDVDASNNDVNESKIVDNLKSLTVSEVAAVPEKIETKPDPAKKLKALRKKLREIDEIAGLDETSLTAEQIEKRNKRAEVKAEIDQLETLLV